MNALPKLKDTVLQLTGLNATLLLAHKVRSDTGSCAENLMKAQIVPGRKIHPFKKPGWKPENMLGLTFCRN